MPAQSKVGLENCLTIAMIFLAFSLTGCKDKPDITWQTQAYSPDHHWLATAHSEGGGAFGGAYDATIVYLNQPEQQPGQILAFDHQYLTLPLHLTWVGPRHLNVTVDPGTNPHDSINVIFQAIKCGDVTITLGPIPNQSSPTP